MQSWKWAPIPRGGAGILKVVRPLQIKNHSLGGGGGLLQAVDYAISLAAACRIRMCI